MLRAAESGIESYDGCGKSPFTMPISSGLVEQMSSRKREVSDLVISRCTNDE